MAINREQFTRLMIEYGFARFPRAVGNPRQAFINDFDTLILFYKLNNGKFPLYTSTNSYWDFDKYGQPTNVYYEKMFFDLDVDTGEDIEIAHRDCQKMAEFCTENKVPHIVSFSGNGFHFYMFFTPKMRTIDSQLTQEIRSVQDYLRGELTLKTVNLVCAEPKRLVRVPLSRYVTGKEIDGWTVKDRFCIPLSHDQLFNNRIQEILILAQHPTLLYKYKVDGNKIKLKNFIKDHKIKVKKVFSIPRGHHEHFGPQIDYTKYTESDIREIVEMLVPLKCLNRMIWTKNPPHFIRFSFCSFLTKVMSKEEAINLFDKIAHDAEWNDRHNKIIRDNQIENIYRNQYTEHSCEELVKLGVCVGGDCPRYKTYLKKKSIDENSDVLNNSKTADT